MAVSPENFIAAPTNHIFLRRGRTLKALDASIAAYQTRPLTSSVETSLRLAQQIKTDFDAWADPQNHGCGFSAIYRLRHGAETKTAIEAVIHSLEAEAESSGRHNPIPGSAELFRIHAWTNEGAGTEGGDESDVSDSLSSLERAKPDDREPTLSGLKKAFQISFKRYNQLVDELESVSIQENLRVQFPDSSVTQDCPSRIYTGITFDIKDKLETLFTVLDQAPESSKAQYKKLKSWELITQLNKSFNEFSSKIGDLGSEFNQHKVDVWQDITFLMVGIRNTVTAWT